jgi:hypothetical protein
VARKRKRLSSSCAPCITSEYRRAWSSGRRSSAGKRQLGVLPRDPRALRREPDVEEDVEHRARSCVSHAPGGTQPRRAQARDGSVHQGARRVVEAESGPRPELLGSPARRRPFASLARDGSRRPSNARTN